MNRTDSTDRRAVAVEIAAVTAAVLVASHILYRLRGQPSIGPYVPAAVAVILIYAPIAALWLRGRRVDFVGGGLRSHLRSAAAFAAASAMIFPPFLVCAHIWQTAVMGRHWAGLAPMPDIAFIASQLVVVAIPEEFYFRGYLQSAADLVWAPRWNILKARLGVGWIVTAAAFAAAHSIVFYRWWHFAIFFPALLFGWLRARTGSIVAPALFHASANILMDWIVRSYA